MIPKSLNDWTYRTVETLCAVGRAESDRHDFKKGLQDATNHTKLCCAFANTYGGFIVLGVSDKTQGEFKIVGFEPDKELYGNFIAKIKADPEISVPQPKNIEIPGSRKQLYIFEILRSPRRPHLPSDADKRIFWKRQGSDCVQMNLEEIRYQMNAYEEKREKLALLLIDLQHKLRSLEQQANMPDNHYNGDVFSFEIIDRVVVESYALLKAEVSVFGVLDTIKSRLMLLNSEKQKMFSIMAMSYQVEFKHSAANAFRETARNTCFELSALTEQIENTLKKFSIVNPYRVIG